MVVMEEKLYILQDNTIGATTILF